MGNGTALYFIQQGLSFRRKCVTCVYWFLFLGGDNEMLLFILYSGQSEGDGV